VNLAAKLRKKRILVFGRTVQQTTVAKCNTANIKNYIFLIYTSLIFGLVLTSDSWRAD